MKYLDILLLLQFSSANFGEWDANSICDFDSPSDFRLNNQNFTIDDCAQFCKDSDEDSQTNAPRCCSFERWTSGLSDCAIFESETQVGNTNEGSYGNINYNFYSSFIFNSTDYSNWTFGEWSEDQMGGSYCINDDSTGDTGGDTCSGWYDANPQGCGFYDDDDFIASV